MKAVIISILIAGVLIAGGIYLSSGNMPQETGPQNNVTIVDGVQIIDIKAKGGYSPRKSTAKAGIPTIIRFETQGTFDCSAAIRIPSLDISKVLTQSGKTDISIGTQQVGTLRGSCGMGMYPFEVDFQS